LDWRSQIQFFSISAEQGPWGVQANEMDSILGLLQNILKKKKKERENGKPTLLVHSLYRMCQLFSLTKRCD
jgi:hypothetical protein